MYYNNFMTGTCKHCGKEHTWSRSSVGVYCSNKCQSLSQHNEKIKLWKENSTDPGTRVLRRYLLEQSQGCWECGITEWMGKPITLELEHKDGDPYNNKEDNLCLLCPNCHSQTPTYKGKNRGRGRLARRERAREDYHRP